MKAKLLSYCQTEDLFLPGQRVICAVSGGADSVLLLHGLSDLARELGICLEAAHFNHMLRGAESDADEAFVKELCKGLGVPLHIGAEDVEAYCLRHHLGTEEGARQCRYRFLHSLGGKIATAHNADDNLETVLMHLIRGSGLRGLCGISPKRENLVRPLLWATGEEIRSYLDGKGIPYRVDSSNNSPSYTRNRLRQQVLPLLRQENPGIAVGVLRQGAFLRQEDRFLDLQARELIQKTPSGAYRIPPLLSATGVLRNRALRLMVGEYLEQDVSFTHIEALGDLLRNSCPSAQLSLPRGLQACRQYDTLLFRQTADSDAPMGPPDAPIPLSVPGEQRIPGTAWTVCCKIQKNFIKMTNTPFHFAIKYDMICDVKIFLRHRLAGDRLELPNGHSKSLKKLMIERKIPRHHRDILPVFTDGSQILAVSGLGVSPRYLPEEGQPALIVEITGL